MRPFRFVSFALLAVLALGTATSCRKSVTNPPAAPARVMAIHASPDAPAVDLIVDGAVAGSGLAFPNNTPYLTVPSGVRQVKLNVAGTSTTVLSASLPTSPGSSYSVFACDSVAKLGLVVLADNLAAPASGQAHVRFVHLSPNAPAVDVAVKNGPVLFGNTPFKGYSSFTPVAAGTYDLEVRLAGTSTVVLPLPGISLQAGRIYTVFAKGFVGGTGPQALGAQIIVNN